MSATTADQGRMVRKERSDLQVFFVVAVPLVILYLLTANWSTPYNLDAFANVQTGYELGRNGDPFLSEEAAVGHLWSVPVGEEYVSHYPPGAALHVAPLFAIWPADASIENLTVSDVRRDIRIPPLAPAAIVSATIAAIAMGLVSVAANRIASSWLAIGTGLVLGLGTGTWAVASHQLWQHGPAMMWVAAGTVLSAHRPLGAGVAFGIAVVTRPHTALVGLSVSIARWIKDRKPWPAVGTATFTVAGLAVVVTYNAWLLGESSISGGYGDSLVTRLLSLGNLGWYAGNIIGSLVNPVRGLLVFSPFLVLLIPGLPAAWRESPWWVRGAAVGGLIYLLVQLKANRFSGGDAYFSYRYPLEALTAAAPLLTLAYERWTDRQWFTRMVFIVLLGYSIVLQAYGVLFTSP